MSGKSDLTELVFIIDRSGSMGGLESDTIGGFNSLISKQKKEEGDAVVTTVLFSDRIQMLHDRVPLAEVQPLTERDYFVGGGTALLDAVGDTVNKVRARQASDPERPAQTLVVITTDGMENSSREFTYEKVSQMIGSLKGKGWDFLFMGANIDVAAEASRLNISTHADFDCSGSGVRACYADISANLSNARRAGSFRK